MRTYLVTSESVTEGHPDKLCDQVSDGILDACLEQDESSRVAIETMVSKGTIFIAGEVTTNAKVNYDSVARQVAREIGYTSSEAGLDADKCLVLTNVNTQSPDIAMGVSHSDGVLGAGDQGIMYGYACNESESFMPMTCYLANRLAMRLAQMRKDEFMPWLYPDGKTQVTMRLDENGKPLEVVSVIVSAHHDGGIEQDYIRDAIYQGVIAPVLGNRWDNGKVQVHINPTGSFSKGGPVADTGLTGRKIMVDTYGGIAHHGGGAFSGKDATKVDRSGAYMARYVAKHIVAAKLAERCEVALAYAIGRAEPEAVTVNTFGTQRVEQEIIQRVTQKVFSFSVSDILSQLDLRRPQFRRTAAYGHFGRNDCGFRWEELDRTHQLSEVAMKEMTDLLF